MLNIERTCLLQPHGGKRMVHVFGVERECVCLASPWCPQKNVGRPSDRKRHGVNRQPLMATCCVRAEHRADFRRATTRWGMCGSHWLCQECPRNLAHRYVHETHEQPVDRTTEKNRNDVNRGLLPTCCVRAENWTDLPRATTRWEMGGSLYLCHECTRSLAHYQTC